ncbi:NADH-quinone oxidoreductase subunit N [Heliorestis acidaminivorans]|uniref:NADH-quinone oxidoreductase subunit N n=1 Tax=Heliorestis acidaminivorans TaxID=553427 RepID=A0A6I0F340_9FIRM|nr:NADH-quinone oxidoreductase subunit N [Heliorestis acidaminivorans]KAB2954411.1 NADH-quinone oxidoreductase subunit N [Heliorestis acidaminivorans]
MNYSLLSTEMLMAALGIGLLVLTILSPREKGHQGIGYAAVFGMVAILVATSFQYGINETTFREIWIVDDFAVFMKQLFLVSAIFVTLSSLDYVRSLPKYHGEFFVMIIFATLGMMVMASANDLITLFVGMELMTVTFFVLVSFLLGNGRSSEAGIKYLILGATSSAIMLYGMSLLYGLTGTTIIPELVDGLTWSPALAVAVIMILAGFGFKIAAIPFHMWSPDIYEGAPTPITAFLAVASKAAGFAVMIRLFIQGVPVTTGVDWIVIIAGLAAITMIVGNVIAIPQTNIKRMLAYSSIAQAGYLLVGMMAADVAGIKSILFYAMIYVFANIGAFAVAIVVGKHLNSDKISDYAGLGQRQPLLAIVMTVSLLSLAGIPPLAGFVGKLYLFAAIMDQGVLWPAFIGFVMSMISVYYYLNVCLYMWRDDPKDDQPIHVSGAIKLTVVVSMVVTLVLGVYPQPLAEMANIAAKALF